MSQIISFLLHKYLLMLVQQSVQGQLSVRSLLAYKTLLSKWQFAIAPVSNIRLGATTSWEASGQFSSR